MDNFKEITNNITETLKLRLGNPILGNFLISFFLFNWKIFLILFSSQDTYLKIITIELLIDSDTFLIPFLISLIYIFVLPWIFRPANIWLLKWKVLSENDRFFAEEGLTPTQKQITTLGEKLARELERNNDLLQLNNSLEQRIHLMTEQIDHLNKSSLNLKVNQEESDIVSDQLIKQSLASAFIKFSNTIITDRLIVGSTLANQFKTITNFYNLGLLERQRIGTSSAEIWILTNLGKEVLRKLEFKKIY